MKTTTLPEQAEAKSPAGAGIRFLMDGEVGRDRTGQRDPSD
jgi:hypothetical protein